MYIYFLAHEVKLTWMHNANLWRRGFGYGARSISKQCLSGLNSEIFFFLAGCYTKGKKSLWGKLAKELDCSFEVSVFKFQLHFWANTIGNAMNLLTHPAMGG